MAQTLHDRAMLLSQRIVNHERYDTSGTGSSLVWMQDLIEDELHAAERAALERAAQLGRERVVELNQLDEEATTEVARISRNSRALGAQDVVDILRALAAPEVGG